jgi:Kinase binding protein CGI-121
MERVIEFDERPVLCVCGSSKGVRSLVESSKGVSGKGGFVLLADYDLALVKRMLPAFMNARLRMADGISRSKSAHMEMLLLLSGTMNIGKALSEHGVKDRKKFLVFATGGAVLRKFVLDNKVRVIRRIALKLDEDVAGDVALTELSGG